MGSIMEIYKKNKLIRQILTLCTIAILIICAILYLTEDRTAPVITYAQDALCDPDHLDEEALLQGVSAEDAKDGDVSDTLRVAQIIEPEEDWIIIVYVAKDHDNNIAKKNRWVNLRTGESSEVAISENRK